MFDFGKEDLQYKNKLIELALFNKGLLKGESAKKFMFNN